MYYAHISEDKTRLQTVKEHLEGTAARAGRFAEAFGCREWGYGIGLLHDIGKYTIAFQKRLLENGPRTDHSTAGAQELLNKRNYAAAYCVAGHHAGLADGGADGDAEATLMGRKKKRVEQYQDFQSEIPFPGFGNIPLRQIEKGGFSVSFMIRMLFSCLVDADYLDTEDFMADHQTGRETGEDMEVLCERLHSHIRPWLEHEDPSAVSGRRTAILKACLARGKAEQGLYTLTVPTGGGKTVSSLAFALEQAKRHHLDRIIYVIPYTSIIEQNAQVFKDILGQKNVLEDHCNVVCENPGELEKHQLAAENWDRPVVVTTNVQFFESLFSNKTSKCRKLHNIAKSVIIFDEAQMLPVKYLKPCVRAISELVYNYHCTAVLCTATQPALEPYFPSCLKAEEICPDKEGQYDFFRRTVFEKKGQLSQDELVEELRRQPQVLCILNNRRRVQQVYEALKEEDACHLSTFMYPEHRKRILKEVRERLKAGKPCRLIATSLVEAGVDLDFGTVFRELAGIDSVIQAAGRCNREGKRNREECRTIVFTMEKTEDIAIPPELKLPIDMAEQVAEDYEDISSLEAIHAYFRQLFKHKGEGTDAKHIVEQFEKGFRSMMFPFAFVAEQFRLIEEDTRTILIDREEAAQLLTQRLERGESTRQVMRDAGHYCVNVYEKDFNALSGAGLLKEITPGLYILRNKEQYSEEEGLVIGAERGEALLF